MESCPEEAVKNNIVGTFYLATLAATFQCEKFIMISTDKAVHPANVMGATKRCCEMIIQYMSQHSTNTMCLVQMAPSFRCSGNSWKAESR